MFCNQCGKSIAEGSVYCNYCGAKVNGTGQSPIQPVVPALSVKCRVCGIVGFVLSIFGLIYALIVFVIAITLAGAPDTGLAIGIVSLLISGAAFAVSTISKKAGRFGLNRYGFVFSMIGVSVAFTAIVIIIIASVSGAYLHSPFA